MNVQALVPLVNVTTGVSDMLVLTVIWLPLRLAIQYCVPDTKPPNTLPNVVASVLPELVAKLTAVP